MNTPPKASCHFCNGTGIDPTVGFLDCEFCTPAFAGVSLSAPEQPEPKCATCNDHGEIGCLRPGGYDGEHCPDCNPATVKRYHITEAGLVEGQALGRINVVLGADHDRVTADADRLRAELECSRGDFAQLERISDALQQRLTAADERADVLEGLLRLARGAIGENQWTLLTKDIDAMLSQDAQRTNNSGNAHCPHDGICHTSDETCAEARARIDSVKPAEGCGDVL